MQELPAQPACAGDEVQRYSAVNSENMTAPERITEVKAGMDRYRHKRAVIAAVERLDCVEDADLIDAIGRALPERAWIKKKRAKQR